jgi:uncharacterized protein (DUF58 family)
MLESVLFAVAVVLLLVPLVALAFVVASVLLVAVFAVRVAVVSWLSRRDVGRAHGTPPPDPGVTGPSGGVVFEAQKG